MATYEEHSYALHMAMYDKHCYPLHMAIRYVEHSYAYAWSYPTSMTSITKFSLRVNQKYLIVVINLFILQILAMTSKFHRDYKCLFVSDNIMLTSHCVVAIIWTWGKLCIYLDNSLLPFYIMGIGNCVPLLDEISLFGLGGFVGKLGAIPNTIAPSIALII